MATSTTPQPDAADPPENPPRAWTLTSRTPPGVAGHIHKTCHCTNAIAPTLLVGKLRPAAAQAPVFKISPVPLILMLSTTIAKQEAPLFDLLTAPLKSTLEFGR